MKKYDQDLTVDLAFCSCLFAAGVLAGTVLVILGLVIARAFGL